MPGRSGPRPLVIGVGNRHRGDDAAGPLVIDALRAAAPASHGIIGSVMLDTAIVDGDLADLARRWQADQAVIIVDACRSGRPPGTVVVVDGLETELARAIAPVSSHGLGVAEAIELARLLDRLPESLTVYGIEATSFGHFAPLTEPVAEAITDVAERIRDTIADH